MREDRREQYDHPKSPIKWILLITVVLLIGVAIQNWWSGSDVSGAYGGPWSGFGRHESQRAGRYAADPAQLTGFDSIRVHGNTTLDITIGQKASVSLDGDPRAVKRIRTQVYNGTLVIRRDGGNWFWNDRLDWVTAHVTVPSLDELSVFGASKVAITGANSGASRITISGASRLVADGKLDSLKLVINGAGDADLTAMQVAAATVVVNGTGRVSLDVRENLDATVNGAGDIVYAREPEHVKSSVHGVGSIRRG